MVRETRSITLKLRFLQSSTFYDLRTTTWQKCEAIPRRARIQGAHTFVSLNSRLESHKEEEEKIHHTGYSSFFLVF